MMLGFSVVGLESVVGAGAAVFVVVGFG